MRADVVEQIPMRSKTRPGRQVLKFVEVGAKQKNLLLTRDPDCASVSVPNGDADYDYIATVIVSLL
jgi:hypothetical protein